MGVDRYEVTTARRDRRWRRVTLLAVAALIVAAALAHLLARSVGADRQDVTTSTRPVAAPAALVEEFRDKLAPRPVSGEAGERRAVMLTELQATPLRGAAGSASSAVRDAAWAPRWLWRAP